MKTPTFPLILALAVQPGMLLAEPRTVILEVPNMTCAVCPLTVKNALGQVAGVQHVTVDYPNKTATVQFDDALTTAEKLTEATRNAGYPSTVRQGKP
jgi:mercuric ion binding protein